MAGMKDGSRYKLQLSIDARRATRFSVYAAARGEDQSAIISRLMDREMRGFTYKLPAVEADPAGEVDGPPIRLAGQADREAG